LRLTSEKDFNAPYDAQIRKTMATFPSPPGIAIVVIKDDRPIFVHAGLALHDHLNKGFAQKSKSHNCS
jgi:hypothetical protein